MSDSSTTLDAVNDVTDIHRIRVTLCFSILSYRFYYNNNSISFPINDPVWTRE
jgi:hypothetical protein